METVKSDLIPFGVHNIVDSKESPRSFLGPLQPLISDPLLFTPQLHKNPNSSFLCSSGMLESDLLENLEDEVDREEGEEELAVSDHDTSQNNCRALTMHFSQF